jgi:hypothetical protein
MKALRQKVELVDLYHHRMEKFNNLKMEHAFMKVELLIYYNKTKEIQQNNGSHIKSKLAKLFERVLNLIRKMRSCISCELGSLLTNDATFGDATF